MSNRQASHSVVADRHLRLVTASRILVSFGITDFAKLNKQGNQFAVISGYRSELGKHTNKGRHGDLVADVQRMGYRKFIPFKSSWTDATGIHPEVSILVPQMKFPDAVALMRAYKQDAILYKDPSGTIGIYSNNGTALMAFQVGTGDMSMDVSMDKDQYSKGRSFSMGLRLVDDQTFRWSGGPITLPDLLSQLRP